MWLSQHAHPTRGLKAARTIAADIAQSHDFVMFVIPSGPKGFGLVQLLTDNRGLVNGKTRAPI